MSQTLEAAIHALVHDCEGNGRPVRGLFALGQLRRETFVRLTIQQAVERLCEMDVAGERFKPFPKADVEGWLNAHPLDQETFSWQQLDLFLRRKAKIRHPVAGDKDVTTQVWPSAWSVVGMAADRGLDVLFDCAMKGAPVLTQAGTELGACIKKGGLARPLGCWVPAFVDCDRTHDLVDAAIGSLNGKTLAEVLEKLLSQSPDPTVLGHYLANQSAHAMDAFDNILQNLTHLGDDFTTSRKDKRMDHSAPRMVGQLLIAGARMTQAQWGGPINQWLTGDRRAFGKGEDRVFELVYTVVGNDFDDETKARTLKRMAAEGHDIVIAHRDRKSSRDRYESKTGLPLHLCAAQGHTKSMGVLLDHGADPTALVLQMGMLKTVEMIAEGLGHPESVSVLRSHAARGRAHSILDEIEGMCPSQPFMTREPALA